MGEEAPDSIALVPLPRVLEPPRWRPWSLLCPGSVNPNLFPFLLCHSIFTPLKTPFPGRGTSTCHSCRGSAESVSRIGHRRLEKGKTTSSVSQSPQQGFITFFPPAAPSTPVAVSRGGPARAP